MPPFLRCLPPTPLERREMKSYGSQSVLDILFLQSYLTIDPIVFQLTIYSDSHSGYVDYLPEPGPSVDRSEKLYTALALQRLAMYTLLPRCPTKHLHIQLGLIDFLECERKLPVFASIQARRVQVRRQPRGNLWASRLIANPAVTPTYPCLQHYFYGAFLSSPTALTTLSTYLATTGVFASIAFNHYVEMA